MKMSVLSEMFHEKEYYNAENELKYIRLCRVMHTAIQHIEYILITTIHWTLLLHISIRFSKTKQFFLYK